MSLLQLRISGSSMRFLLLMLTAALIVSQFMAAQHDPSHTSAQGGAGCVLCMTGDQPYGFMASPVPPSPVLVRSADPVRPGTAIPVPRRPAPVGARAPPRSS